MTLKKKNERLQSQLKIWMHFHIECGKLFREPRIVENICEWNRVTLWRDDSKIQMLLSLGKYVKSFHESRIVEKKKTMKLRIIMHPHEKKKENA